VDIDEKLNKYNNKDSPKKKKKKKNENRIKIVNCDVTTEN
jgi:hypothetical protein